MAMIACTPTPFPESSPLIDTVGALAITINATGEYAAYVVMPSRSAQVDLFEFRTGTVGTNPLNGLDASFQDLDAAGLPDGVRDQFRVVPSVIAANTWQVPGLITSDGTNTGTKRTTSAGVPFACVVGFSNFTAGNSVNLAMGTPATFIDLPYVVESGAKNTSVAAVMALKYSDGTYEQFPVNSCLPIIANLSPAFNSGSTPDERGNIFSLPLNSRIAGYWLGADIDAAADVVLYDLADNVINSASLTAAFRRTTGMARQWNWFSSTVDLIANTQYRIVLKPTTVSSVSLQDFDVSTSALMGAVSGGTACSFTSRTNAGAWTNTATKRAQIGVIYTAQDNATGTLPTVYAFAG